MFLHFFVDKSTVNGDVANELGWLVRDEEVWHVAQWKSHQTTDKHVDLIDC